MHFPDCLCASIKIFDAHCYFIIAKITNKIKAQRLQISEILCRCFIFDVLLATKCKWIILFDAHFLFMIYNNFPNLFIISTLCSSKE